MKKIFLFGNLGFCLITSSAFIMHSGGEIGKTGSPGEATCANCHSGGAGITTVSVNATPAITNNQYVPGQVYNMTITVANASLNKYGFDCEILTSTNANAGTISNAGPGVQFANSGAKKNATHTATKAGTGSADFTFDWTAPASGNAIIYVGGNAVNGNNSDTGDKAGNIAITLSDITAGIKENAANTIQFNFFPNPAASEINAEYKLIRTSEVSIGLFDLSGKEVLNLSREKQEPGIHLISKTLPADLAAGIYMIKFSMNDKVAKQQLFIKR